MGKIKIFISYSHENEEWVSKEGKYKLIPWLEKQLDKQAEIWTDHALKKLIGEEYTKLITQEINEADIALLLISQDFVSSAYIMDVELPLIRQQYKDGNLKIIPLLITNLTKKGKEKISWIFDLQIYPCESTPLVNFAHNDADWAKVKVELLEGIETKIESLSPNLESVKNKPEKSNQNKNVKRKKTFKITFTLAISFFITILIVLGVNNSSRLFFSSNNKNHNSCNQNINQDSIKEGTKLKAISSKKDITKSEQGISNTKVIASRYYDLGCTYYNNKEYERAVKAFSDAISIYNDFSEAYRWQGASYFLMEEYDKAIDSYEKAVLINPKYADAYHGMGLAYFGKKNFGMQKECFKKAARLGHKGCQEWLKARNETW